jgi:hypothetical protein
LANPFEVRLYRENVTVQLNVNWGTATTAWNGADRVDFNSFAEGSGSNGAITLYYNNTSGTAQITDVPIGKRKITATAAGSAGVTAHVTPTEVEITVVRGTNNVANFTVNATKQ